MSGARVMRVVVACEGSVCYVPGEWGVMTCEWYVRGCSCEQGRDIRKNYLTEFDLINIISMRD